MNEKQIAVLKAAQRTIASRNIQTTEGKQAVAELVSDGLIVLITAEFVSELETLRNEAHPNRMEGDREGDWTIGSAREDINSYVLTEAGAAWLNENAPHADFSQWQAPHYLNAANVYRSMIANKKMDEVTEIVSPEGIIIEAENLQIKAVETTNGNYATGTGTLFIHDTTGEIGIHYYGALPLFTHSVKRADIPHICSYTRRSCTGKPIEQVAVFCRSMTRSELDRERAAQREDTQRAAEWWATS